MTTPLEPLIPPNPELEALLAAAPPDVAETVRSILAGLGETMSADNLAAMQRVFISDLESMQRGERLAREMAEMETQLKELEKSTAKLKELLDELKNSGEDQPA